MKARQTLEQRAPTPDVAPYTPPSVSASATIYGLHGTVPPETFLLLLAAILLPGLGVLVQNLPQPMFALPAVGFSLAAVVWQLVSARHTPHMAYTPWLGTAWPLALLVVAQCGVALAGTQVPVTYGSLANTTLWPLTLWGGGGLALPVVTLLAAGALRHTRHSWLHINQVMLCLFASPATWFVGVNTPALLVWGLAALAITLLLAQPRLSRVETLSLTLLCGILAGAFPLAVPFPLFVAIGLAAVWPTRALTLLCGVGAILLAQNSLPPMAAEGAFPGSLSQLIPTMFAPIWAAGAVSRVVATGCLITVGVLLTYHWRWWPPVAHTAWGLGTLTLLVALGNLASAGVDASFPLTGLVLALPIVIYTLLKPNFRKSA
jgi:hypothetical protein